jgi:hypothetical protein
MINARGWASEDIDFLTNLLAPVPDPADALELCCSECVAGGGHALADVVYEGKGYCAACAVFWLLTDDGLALPAVSYSALSQERWA